MEHLQQEPYWTIQFETEQALTGKATLTLGFVSANPPRGGRTNLQVKVNGKEVEVVHLPKTGTAGYRSGSSDSVYHVGVHNLRRRAAEEGGQ